MVRRCFVYNCPTRYSNKDKVSLFKCPNNEQLFEKWRQNVPQKNRALMKDHRICEKHFPTQCVIPRYQQVKGDFYQDLLRPRLTPNAVPTIFPNTEKHIRKLAPNNPQSIVLDIPKKVQSIVLKQTCLPLVIAPPKESETLLSLMTKEISKGIEVNELEYVPICFKCLTGKCSSHIVTVL